MITLKKTVIPLWLFIFTALTASAHTSHGRRTPSDNAHYYQTPSFHGRSPLRLPKWASTFEVNWLTGSTKRGTDNNSNRAPVFDIYGTHNIKQLATDVPDSSNPTIKPLFTNLLNSDTGDNLGLVSIKGKFKVDSVELNYHQELSSHFFFEAGLPIKKIKINRVSLTDLGNRTAASAQAVSDWDTLLANLDNVLAAYDMKPVTSKISHIDIDDIRLHLGWQKKIKRPLDGIKHLLFTLRTGLVLPTSPGIGVTYALNVPTGYNGHFGIPFRADATARVSKNIELGLHTGLTFFFDKTKNLRLPTSPKQSGLIKLYEAKVEEEMSTLVFGGGFINLDHFFKGFSLMAAYSFNAQGHKELSLHPCPNFPNVTSDIIINCDPSLKGWYFHTAHFMAEYDFGVHTFFKKRHVAPRIGLFYNYQLEGRNTFVTNTTGMDAGIDVCWKF